MVLDSVSDLQHLQLTPLLSAIILFLPSLFVCASSFGPLSAHASSFSSLFPWASYLFKALQSGVWLHLSQPSLPPSLFSKSLFYF